MNSNFSKTEEKLIMNFGDVLYESKERVATITLNRPERFNAISETMPGDIAAAFDHANNDDSVHVIVLTGAGRGFCGGYELGVFHFSRREESTCRRLI